MLHPPKWCQRSIDAPESDLLTKAEVWTIFGISEDTLDRMIDEGEFPEGIKVGKRAVVWEWRSIVYVRLRMEMQSRLRPQLKGKSPQGE